MMILSAIVFTIIVGSTVSADFELHSTDELKYSYYPWKGPTIKFQVKATNDVHFIFSTSSDPDLGSNDQFIEVVIGGWSNGQSVIRKSRSETAKVVTQTPGVVSGEEFRSFWVKVVGNNGFMIGKELETVPMMAWTDPDPLKITHFGLCTGFGSTGDWKVSDRVDVADTPCSPDDVQKGESPWNDSPALIVKQTCYDMLTEQCQKEGGDALQDRMPAGQKSYVIENEMKNWDEAKSSCEAKGLRLASVRSKEEQLLLDTALKNFKRQFSGVWLAANDRAMYNHFVWQNRNDPVTFTNWENINTPSRDKGSGKNCVFASYVALIVRKNAMWFIQRCTSQWHYACEKYD